MYKRNKQNVKINLNSYDEFTQGSEFIIFKEERFCKYRN